MIHGPPKIVSFTVDLHEHLVQMPALKTGFHAGNSALSDLSCKQRAEPMPPVPHSIMAYIDAALVKDILGVPERQREPHIHHNRQADNLTARFKIAK